MTWSHPEWREVLKTGRYLTVTSPLKALPVHVLSELAEVVLDDLGSAPHILHAVIQPQLTRIRLPATLRTVPLAVKLIVERTHKLASFELQSICLLNLYSSIIQFRGYLVKFRNLSLCIFLLNCHGLCSLLVIRHDLQKSQSVLFFFAFINESK